MKMSQGSPELLKMLAEIEPRKPYGTALFDALAKATISIGVEAVCLRLNLEKKVEVYLTQRSPNDAAYPGEWHCPGSVLRPTENWEDVFKRLAEREFGGRISSTRFIANANDPAEARAHFISVIYLCTLEEPTENPKGKWFPVNHLPEKTVDCHRYRIIPAAV